MTPDYLTDARLIKIGYMPLKNALKAANVPTADLSTATTKFALVAIAEKHKVDLERILDSAVTSDAPTAVPSTPKKVPKKAPKKSEADAAEKAKAEAAEEADAAAEAKTSTHRHNDPQLMGCAPSHAGAADERDEQATTRGLPTAKQTQLGDDAVSSTASVLQRAAAASLPERLTLGLTLEAMEILVAGMPSDIVQQCNAAIPKDKTGQPAYPTNADRNGYVNQFHAARLCKEDGLSTCERLQQQGAAGVGVAHVFVSWFLQTPLSTLLDAVRQYLLQHPELPRDATRFWVCDYAIRQADARADVKRLGDCVRAIGHTVLLMEPWDDPMPLRRAYCIKEVYHTQASGARFDMVMSTPQQAAFETALVEDFDSIQLKLSKVDVRQAECLKPEDQQAILSELDREVGLMECNRLVFGLLRGALAAQARAALDRLPPALGM